MKTKPSLPMTQPILSTPGVAVTAVYVPVRPPRPLWQRIWMGGTLLAGFIILLLLGAGAVWFWQGDYLLPGTAVLGVEVGGMTQTEATAVLARYWQQQTIALEADGFGMIVPPDALGMQFDAAATAVLVHQFSRSPRRWQQWWSHDGRLDAPPVWEFNPALAEAGLAALAPELAVPAADAQLVWQDGRLAAQPAAMGQELDVSATLARLAQNPAQVFVDGRLPLVVQPISPAVTDVSQAAAALNRLLATAVTLQAYDPITDETVTRALDPAVWG
ncbi:MAG: peptidoglycan binding domain-containing protein, partial [Anaerolineae bacterium]